jgi:hypothetical protein
LMYVLLGVGVEWSSAKPSEANPEVCDVCQALMWTRRAWGRGVRAVPRLCIVYPGICLTTEEKSRINLSQGNRKALGWSVPNAVRLVDLAIAGDGLDWLARRRGNPRSAYLPSCRTRGFPHQLTLSRSSQSGLWCGRQTAEHPDPCVSACYVPGGTSSEVKTLGL